ncbi:unnamed protein product [Symbiodinium microadriaticum]|nr:unnamed protein product [Symbiodinium microadriaticum]
MKTLKQLLSKPHPHWVGDGFHVYPVLNEVAFTSSVSPFLMLDYGAPKNFPPTTKKLGVGQHPHRGFETVTIAYQGEVEHGDSVGHRDVIGPGDVQWMTAASGIIHEEFHSTEFAKNGGVFEMVQLWVNLPARHKMDPPKYQPILSRDIPVVDLDESGSKAKIIAGDFNGVGGTASTHTPINMWDISLKAHNRVTLPVPSGHNTILLLRSGSVLLKDDDGSSTNLRAPQVALLSIDGESCLLEAASEDADILVLSGTPIDEPIAARGPFVMNTQKELQKAMADYHSGQLGQHF